jgi:hypothetical protein
VATTSRHKEKPKEPVLAKEPEEIPLPYVSLYPPLPPALYNGLELYNEGAHVYFS